MEKEVQLKRKVSYVFVNENDSINACMVFEDMGAFKKVQNGIVENVNGKIIFTTTLTDAETIKIKKRLKKIEQDYSK